MPGAGVSLVVCCGSVSAMWDVPYALLSLATAVSPQLRMWCPASPAAFSACAMVAHGMSQSPLEEVLVVNGACSLCSIPVGRESRAALMGDSGKQRATLERGTRCSSVPLLLAPKFQVAVAVAAPAPAPAGALTAVPAQLPPALPFWGSCKPEPGPDPSRKNGLWGISTSGCQAGL